MHEDEKYNKIKWRKGWWPSGSARRVVLSYFRFSFLLGWKSFLLIGMGHWKLSFLIISHVYFKKDYGTKLQNSGNLFKKKKKNIIK